MSHPDAIFLASTIDQSRRGSTSHARHRSNGTQGRTAGVGFNFTSSLRAVDAQMSRAAGDQATPTANDATPAKGVSLSGLNPTTSQASTVNHAMRAGGDQLPRSQAGRGTHTTGAAGTPTSEGQPVCGAHETTALGSNPPPAKNSSAPKGCAQAAFNVHDGQWALVTQPTPAVVDSNLSAGRSE